MTCENMDDMTEPEETQDAWKERMGIGKRSNFARLVGGEGSTMTQPVHREDGPGVAGTTTEHWSGRQDAAAFAPTVSLQKRAQEIGR